MPDCVAISEIPAPSNTLGPPLRLLSHGERTRVGPPFLPPAPIRPPGNTGCNSATMSTFTVQYDLIFELTKAHLWTVLLRPKPCIRCSARLLKQRQNTIFACWHSSL